MNKILTVIIPSYNVEKYLDKTLPTYISLDILNDIEVLVVNDGSLDGTVEVAKKYIKSYPQTFTLIDKPNGGHGSTLNSGIAEAKGKYIRVIDGDDYVDTSEFVKYVKMLKKIDVDAVYTPFSRVNVLTQMNEKSSVPVDYFNSEFNIDSIDTQVFEEYYALHSLTFSKKVLERIPKITEKIFYVDQEYIMYALAYVKTIKFLNYNVYQYRVGDSSQSMAIENQKKNVWMLRKVTFNILGFFYDNKKGMLRNVQRIYEIRIAKLVHKLIHIYIHIGNSQSKKEVIEILNKVKEDNDIYQKIDGIEFRVLNFSSNLYFFIVYAEKLYRSLKLR